MLAATCWLVSGRAESNAAEAYEGDLIARSLEALELVPDPQPAGKIIEQIVILRHPIIEPSDPWPDFLNIFHLTTREHIVRQELLFRQGDRYDEELVHESARNLRSFPLVFSTVQIVTARGSGPERTVVVVITKDLWSIRLNSQFSVGGGVFNYVSLMPTEQNFLGLNQQLSLYTRIDQDTTSIGQIYQVPRVLGSRLMLFEDLHLRVNHRQGKPEGGFGSLILSRPLFSVAAAWGFSLGASFDIGTDRFYQGSHLRRVQLTVGNKPWELYEIFDHHKFAAQLQLLRSFGLKWKTDLRFGYNLHSNRYTLPDSFPETPLEVRQAFEATVLPGNNEAGELFFGVGFYQASYHRFLNIQTFGLTEDFRFGPHALLELAWANPVFGFAQNSVVLKAGLGYQFLLGQDILSLSTSLSVRWRPDHHLPEADTDWVDRFAEFYLENVSPTLLRLGRLFFRFRYVYSQHRLDRTKLYLGGDNTLRGFISGFRAGPRLLNVNLEFRSLPWVIKTLHFGFVVFYDGGDAYGFTRDTDFSYHQSIGFGIRGLFPQFDRGTMRLDVGVPLGKDFHSQLINWVTLSYLQAF